MEIDIFGTPAPTCRGATRLIKRTVARLPEETWGHIGSWRCIWAQYEVYCARPSVRIYATNPGG